MLERRIRELVNIDAMQFDFKPSKGMADGLFVLRMQKDYRDKRKKWYMSFVDIERAFDRVPRKVMERAKTKKGFLEVIVRAVMSLYHGAKTCDLSYLKNFWYKLVYIKDLCCRHFFLQVQWM